MSDSNSFAHQTGSMIQNDNHVWTGTPRRSPQGRTWRITKPSFCTNNSSNFWCTGRLSQGGISPPTSRPGVLNTVHCLTASAHAIRKHASPVRTWLRFPLSNSPEVGQTLGTNQFRSWVWCRLPPVPNLPLSLPDAVHELKNGT